MQKNVLAIVLFLVAASCAEPFKNDPTKGDQPFDGLTFKQIKGLVEKAQKDKETKIDGSDNKNNQIPQGTILCYVTNDGRYGKLKVLEYGYNLAVKWVTYDKEGRVFSKGDRLVVKGTWQYDLDYGVEGDKGKSNVDFWWEQVDKTVRHLVFRNGAVLTAYREKK
jgi:hypothetical protein